MTTESTTVNEPLLNNSDTSFGSLVKLMLLDPGRTEVIIMWLFLLVLIVGFMFLLKAWNDDDTNQILITDLICTDGRINESKMARFGAFVVSTWAFVYMVVTEAMTEWYFIGYMTAWVGNALFNKYMSNKKEESEPTTTV